MEKQLITVWSDDLLAADLQHTLKNMAQAPQSVVTQLVLELRFQKLYSNRSIANRLRGTW